MDSNTPLSSLKSGGSPALALEWQAALGAHPLFALPGAETVLAAATAPAQLLGLAEMARSIEPHSALAALLEAVDDSDASLGDWLASLALIREYLRQTHRRIDLRQAIGYLHCCAASATDASLPETTADMLRRYGIDT